MAKTALRSAARGLRALRAAEHTSTLDTLIHERVRLGIVSALAANSSLSFSDLKSTLKTTDGNISVHARRLEEAGYVVATKSFEDRMPRTDYKLTSAGRIAFQEYLSHMEALVRAARER